MVRFGSFIRLYRYLIFIIAIGIVFCPLLIIIYQQPSITYQYEVSNSSDDLRYKEYCRQIDQRISVEKTSYRPVRKLSPKYGNIPYSYSEWRSSSLMPRLLTQCEHAIYMDLLSILIERVFKKYNIQYMMMAATLLGKYR